MDVTLSFNEKEEEITRKILLKLHFIKELFGKKFLKKEIIEKE